jgi:hypothetical protein
MTFRCVCTTPSWPRGSTFARPQCSYCETTPHDVEWAPYGRKLAGARKRSTLALSQAQCDALAELSATLRPDERLLVMQTYSESGGTHVYTHSEHEGDCHVARNGSITSLGGP